MGAGLTNGFCCLFSGIGMGLLQTYFTKCENEAYRTSESNKPEIFSKHGRKGFESFKSQILCYTFAEALGLYGLIVGLLMVEKRGSFSQ